MFLVEDQIVGELDWVWRAPTSIRRPDSIKSRGRADHPVHVSVAHALTLGSAKPCELQDTSRYAQLGAGMNLVASLTNVAKESASIFRIMCERWI
jgi:hypothetical protein